MRAILVIMIMHATSTNIDRARGVSARISAVSTYVPQNVLDNESLAKILGEWSANKIYEKTGILRRHIADETETAADMGVAACEKLFKNSNHDRNNVDFLIFCTQAPDYFLPTSACIIQSNLGLRKSIGALDINLGCSGFVYGLSLATGLIAGGMARSVLLVTADTYSKYIHEHDRSVRTLFGDGAAAVLIEAVDDECSCNIGSFVFGTDGSGANALIVEAGGARLPRSAGTSCAKIDASGNWRSRDNLYMNGPAVMNFTLREVPKLFREVKHKANLDDDGIDFLIMHQANKFMLDALVKKMGFAVDRTPYEFENIGNTVSSTIPFVLANLYETGQISSGKTAVLLGFGVGLSWAGCVIKF